jgi:hypothetical protein
MLLARVTLGLVGLLLVFLSLGSTPAYAYIDPGTGAYLWQVLVTLCFGAMFAIRTVRVWIVGRVKSLFNKNRGPKDREEDSHK